MPAWNSNGRATAGRIGGLVTKGRMPPEFYREIGRKGGKARGRKALIAKANAALHSVLPTG